jgi:hypothetical protein
VLLLRRLGSPGAVGKQRRRWFDLGQLTDVRVARLNTRICRNEYFLPAHIYTPDGILTHGLLTLSAITTLHFPSFW